MSLNYVFDNASRRHLRLPRPYANFHPWRLLEGLTKIGRFWNFHSRVLLENCNRVKFQFSTKMYTSRILHSCKMSESQAGVRHWRLAKVCPSVIFSCRVLMQFYSRTNMQYRDVFVSKQSKVDDTDILCDSRNVP